MPMFIGLFIHNIVVETVIEMTRRKFFANILRQMKNKSIRVMSQTLISMPEQFTRRVIHINRNAFDPFTIFINITQNVTALDG